MTLVDVVIPAAELVAAWLGTLDVATVAEETADELPLTSAPVPQAADEVDLALGTAVVSPSASAIANRLVHCVVVLPVNTAWMEAGVRHDFRNCAFSKGN